jgi:rod shape-determining protein MreC
VSRPTGRQRRALVLLLILALIFITLDYRSSSFNGIRDGAQSVFGPVQRGVSAAVRPVGRFFAGIPDAARSHGRITQLEAQNAELRRKLRENELTGTRVDELTRLRLLAGLGQYRIVPAVVVSVGPSLGFEWTVTVDVGSGDGVKVDQTVVNGDGLVGRVKQVAGSTAVVVLAVDPGSSVGVRLAGSNQLGVAAGAGLGPLTFAPLDPQSTANVGDRLVTGPYGGTTYVPGVPVGEVVSVTGQPGSSGREAVVRPYVRYAALDLVGVVIEQPRTDPRDSVLPPKPTPTPSPGANGSGPPASSPPKRSPPPPVGTP